MLTLLLHLVFRTFYYYSTLILVQHVGVLIKYTLYISIYPATAMWACQLLVGMPVQDMLCTR